MQLDQAPKMKKSTKPKAFRDIQDALADYEGEITKLQKELREVQGNYLHAVTARLLVDDQLSELQDADAAAALKSQMNAIEETSRQVMLSHDATGPTTIITSATKLKHWKHSLSSAASKRKLDSLGASLRSLEHVSTLLKLDADKQPAPDRTPVTNPKCDCSHDATGLTNLEIISDDECRVWLDPMMIAEPLFAETALRAKGTYKATAMELVLEDDMGTQAKTRAIVDSGAAWSAINHRTLKAAFPRMKIADSDRAFKDASNNRMKVRGKVGLKFRLGDLLLNTTVYVFDDLGAEFLLGVNSMHTHGLAISTQRHELFSEKPGATPASREPVQFTHSTFTISDHYHNDDECPEVTDDPPQPFSPALTMQCVGGLASTTRCQLQGRAALDYDSLDYDPNARVLTVTAGRHRSQSVIKTIDQPYANHEYMHQEEAIVYMSLLRTLHDYTIKPGERTKELRLGYDTLYRGPVSNLMVTPVDSFKEAFEESLGFADAQLHSTLNLHVPFLVRPRATDNAMAITIPAGTVVARATHHRAADGHCSERIKLAEAVPLTLKTKLDPAASPLKWRKVDRAPGAAVVVGGLPMFSDRALECPALRAKLRESLTITEAEWNELRPPELLKGRLRMSHHVEDGQHIYCPAEELDYEQGGRPRTKEDLHLLGYNLDKAIDPLGMRDSQGNYPPLPEEQKQQLYDIALRWQCVWSRDAKTPELSRLVVIDVPVGDARPVAQKPYPLPYKYLDAVRKEVQKLLEGGLIEPCISNWASPVLIRLKKDSRPDNIRLKLIIDFRRLNEVTQPDSAGLGSQDEILNGFGGDQKFAGIVDAAGGFYQFLINPKDRHRTAFVLPTSMGGTSFQWRVAPYGLTRNPAGYSRGMMFALKGLGHCELPGGQGGAASWIDDVSFHADSFQAYAALFERILQRIAFAGMSLKAEKCFLLHQELEVLGYHITPHGLIMQEDKLKDLRERYDKDGNPFGPANVKEIRQFLGVVQFYRRFVPRLALLAAPMNALLKKIPDGDPRNRPGTPEHTSMMQGVQQSYEAITTFLQSSAVVSAPDLKDPLAEYVICPDACDIAVGGVLMQWQWPVQGENGPGPPAGVPLRGGKGTDPLTQSWRLGLGWKLRTIEYYSKTLDAAQQNYPTHDKESAAILLCCRKWAQYITCHPTTVYTDSAVAASMLTKHLGPHRLQRWGMELGTFLPYLKIQHRAGILNGMADFLSRFPTFAKYVAKPGDFVHLPDGDYADVCDVPLFTHQLTTKDEWVRSWHVMLREDPTAPQATAIWHGDADAITLLNEAPSQGRGTDEQTSDARMASLVSEVGQAVALTPQWREQQEFEQELMHWQAYFDVFQETHGRPPIVYDLYCGEGGFSRGARAVGCDCYGFDINSGCRHRYEHEPDVTNTAIPSCMTFHLADLTQQSFWDQLALGQVNGTSVPLPDILHASPPCSPFTRVAAMRSERPEPTIDELTSVDTLLKRLKHLEHQLDAEHNRRLVWQVENVPESQAHVSVSVASAPILCGTMMGHHVFRHRKFYCNYPLHPPTRHSHEGKIVGSRGIRGNAAFNAKFDGMPTPNMYGVYSKPYMERGSAHEWHGAMGAIPGTYSARGLAGSLPTGYGRLTAGQMLAHSLNRELGCPVWQVHELGPIETECIRSWATSGYRTLRQATAGEELHRDLCAPITVSDSTDWGTIDLPDEPFANKFIITRQMQLQDSDLATILTRLEQSPTQAVNKPQSLHSNYLIRNEKLYRKDFSGADLRLQLMVPQDKRAALMHHFHYSNHRGSDVLINQLQHLYWWPGMTKDCEDFTATCKVCGPLKSGGLQKVPDQPIPTPSQPFSVIHVDHKGPLPTVPGRKDRHILVVVCALTRFTLFLPVISTTAEETLSVLVARVFCTFGTPAVIVSDNGPAFTSDLNAAAEGFYGYRHIHTLPYNPQANGMAEAAVKRIKLLLDRQTKDYANWHQLLPMAQHLLNTTVHTGTGMTPFEAVFGRAPISLEQLENPELYPDGDGQEMLRSIKARMLHLHRSLRQASDSIKNARTDEKNARENAHLRNARRGTVLASTPGNDRYVWLLYGSPENAAYIRKHGHGAPWRHRYKVLEVKPHAVRLEIPTDKSVPRVMEWQPMRRVCVAHPNEHGPTGMEPYLTDRGLAIGRQEGQPAPVNGDVDDQDDEVYEIDHVLRAERIGRYYRIWLKWKGYDEVSYRWRHDLVKETTNQELLDEIQTAVTLAKARYDAEHGLQPEDEDSDEDESPTLPTPPTVTQTPSLPGPPDDRPIAQRKPKRAVTTASQQVVNLLQAQAYDDLICFMAVCHDYSYCSAVGEVSRASGEKRRLRARPEPPSIVAYSLQGLPQAPGCLEITTNDRIRLAELRWDAQQDKIEDAAFLNPYLSREFLELTTLPVIATFAWMAGTWEAWTIACEDLDMAAVDPSNPNPCYGLFAAQTFTKGDHIAAFNGKLLTTTTSGSTRYMRAVRAALPRPGMPSYLYELPERVKANKIKLVPSAKVKLFDGSTCRAGGAKRANSAHGRPGLKDNAVITPDGDVEARLRIPALDPRLGIFGMASAAILVDYGQDFWAGSSDYYPRT